VFASQDGTALDEANVRHMFYRILEKAELRRVRFHDLRHTFAFRAFLYLVLVPAPLDGVDLVTGPVLVQLGDMDAFFPAVSAGIEASFWRATVPEIQTLQNMGHNVNLHVGRPDSWEGIDGWLKQTLAK